MNEKNNKKKKSKMQIDAEKYVGTELSNEMASLKLDVNFPS